MASPVEPSRSSKGSHHLHISRHDREGGDGPVETRVHLRRTGSVDIFAVSPHRISSQHQYHGPGTNEHPEDRDATLFEGTLDTPDRRYLRVSTDAHLRDSTSSGGGFRDYHHAARGVPKQISSVTTSSKAVLSALRALQDKIKRLEHERTAATEEVARLRKQVAELEQEVDSKRQQDATSAQEKHHAARLAYERLLADKNAVDLRLSKTEEERNELLAEVSSLRARLQSEGVARQQAEDRLHQAERRLEEYQQQQSWASSSAAGGVRRPDPEASADEARSLASSIHNISALPPPPSSARPATTEALRAMELELNAERRQRMELEEKRDKIGELLVAVLSMNEHLVEHLGSPKKKKKAKKVVSSTGGSKKAPPSSLLERQAGGGGLNTAARAKARKTTTATTSAKASTASSSTRDKKKPGATANLLLQLPFLPAPHKRTFNLLASLSEAVRQCKTREPKQVLDALYELIINTDYTDKTGDRPVFGGGDAGEGGGRGGGAGGSSPPRGGSSMRSRRGVLGDSYHLLGEDVRSSAGWSPPRGQTCAYASPPRHTGGGEEDFERLLNMLEDELGKLKKRHHEIVTHAREHGGVDHLTPEDLQAVLTEIQRKEQEVKLLRSGRRKLHRGHEQMPKSPLVSPYAAKRTTERLSVLNGIRGLSGGGAEL